ncbi:MAG: cysteine hydrolase family protein [Planctomycetaceae bacterium]
MSDEANLHGSVPDTSPAVLVLIDVINRFDFEGADALLEHAAPMAERLSDLVARARQANVAIVYVNDNFGRWTSDRERLLETALADDSPGRDIVHALKPQDNDYFVIKPKHSGFFNTTLDLLLRHLEARTLILTGLATNICVLFTANDAYMRDYKLIVASDCCAAEVQEDHEAVLALMAKVLKANVCPGDEIDLHAI